MKWETVKLNSICRPKQWPTLSVNKLSSSGYPVYGANGKIGFYNKYSHEQPTLMITCRGATCGNVHISEPFSYINGNAMALDSMLEHIDIKFLYYFFSLRGFQDVISGSAQPQITRQGLENLQIPLPPLPTQRAIADRLDRADALRQKDRQLLQEYDALAQSVFVEMFGDPVLNEKGWKKEQLASNCRRINVGFVGRCEEFYTNASGVPLIRTGNLTDSGLILRNLKYVTAEFHQQNKKSQIQPGDILIARHGDNGKACLVGPDIKEANTLNIVIVSVDKKQYLPEFVTHIFNSETMRTLIASKTGGATQKVVNTKAIQMLEFPHPPLPLQKKFADILTNIEQQKALVRKQRAESEALFGRLLQEAFE